MFQKQLKNVSNQVMKLCTPSRVYLILSVLSIGVILLQNMFDTTKYCLGNYSCSLDYSNYLVFLVKIVYVGIFTVVLDSLCKNKYTKLAWVLLLLPYVLMFFIMFEFIKMNSF